MIPAKIKSLIEKYCMGMIPSSAHEDEIMDAVMAAGLNSDQRLEVCNYVTELINGPTREQKAAAEAAKKEEAKRKAEEKAKQKAKEEARKKAAAEEALRLAEEKRYAEWKAQEDRIKEFNIEKRNKILKILVGVVFGALALWCGLSLGKEEKTTYGSLMVEVTPMDAEIYIDGIKRGTSPEIIEDIPVGEHTVKVSMPGYKDLVKQIEIRENEQSSLSGELENAYVDLGLPSGLLWATCNVGASGPSEYGDYFAWGETSPKSNYYWDNLKYCNDRSGNNFSKYNKNQAGTKDDKTKLELSDDAARANWGGSWRMPTKEEWVELENSCTWIWTSHGGHNGYEITGKNGNSIFLPAAGHRELGRLCHADERGDYWSSSLSSSSSHSAYYCWFNSRTAFPSWTDYRYYGQSIRPVYSSL